MRSVVGRVIASVALLGASFLGAPSPAGAVERTLSFADRVQAQEAIDRVYYSHQLGAKRAFEDAVPRSVIERKVRTYLQQSIALERFWQTRITSDALRQEAERIERNTQMPDRLAELYEALDGDLLLIQECLVRPVLVDRLVRSFFANDEVIHAAEKRTTEILRSDLASGRVNVNSEHPWRSVMQIVRKDSAEEERNTESSKRRVVSASKFADWNERLSLSDDAVGPIDEREHAYVVSVTLHRSPEELEVATFTVEKKSWDVWWAEVEPTLDESELVTTSAMLRKAEVGQETKQVHEMRPSTRCPPSQWDNGSLDDAPEPRTSHSAIWTGSHMIVWGGADRTNSGDRYDPATDSWERISRVNAPSPRARHTAVWTGSHMLIWGGSSTRLLASGSLYDPVADSWTPITETNAPTPRHRHHAVWTGSRMLVWGGRGQGATRLDTGGVYDPEADAWTPMSVEGAPQVRDGASLVWTGQHAIVWGRRANNYTRATGARYDPDTATWTPVSDVDSPEARSWHGAVWTGEAMMIWGGTSPPNGGLYDPATDSWATVAVTGAPTSHGDYTTIWTGREVIVWGGLEPGSSLDPRYSRAGGIYDPVSNRWRPIATINAPSGREGHSAVWADGLMVVWGGWDSVALSSGGRFDLATNSWTPTAQSAAPSGRTYHTAIWTGTHMVVWGGEHGYWDYVKTGGRYDPVLDSWTATSTSEAPVARAGHTAVWTGDEMIVWGGYEPGAYLSSGGRYDPLLDSWAATAEPGAPLPRYAHTAVWTGREMIVWGGTDNIEWLASGSRYDPVANRWAPTATVGAPEARYYHEAVWTGEVMIAWGGVGPNRSHDYRSGGRYDPETDSWVATSLVGAPPRSARATWTGQRMLAWSTDDFGGGSYDPIANAWTPMSTSNAPPPYASSLLWSGDELIVWGGDSGSGRYAPESDTWSWITPVREPTPRARPSAVWASNGMIVWGGTTQFGKLRSGGRLVPGPRVDTDGDGVSECDGDCHASDSAVFDRPHEIRNVRWVSRDEFVWDSLAEVSGAGIVYDVLYDRLQRLSRPWESADECLAEGTTATMTQDLSPTPPANEGWFFLIRGRNACGRGRWNTGPGGDDLYEIDCP